MSMTDLGQVIETRGAKARAPRVPTHLNMSEWFGPTVQGEGPSTGRIVGFIRVALCNLSCSWCDTPYTWDWDRFDRKTEVHRMSIDEVADIVTDLVSRGAKRIVVSGGEPLSQHAALAVLMRRFPDVLWEVETNGTKSLGDTQGLWSTIVSSPKVIPSADPGEAGRAVDLDTLRQADLKFVVQDQADLEAVVAFVAEHGFDPDRVWLMPEGVTPESLTSKSQFVADAAIKHGFNFSSRLHVYAWHDVRGH